MASTNFKELLDAGVHFGHLKRKWNPNMAPYIYMERNGIHVIDLQKTSAKLDEASAALKQIAKSGRKILFVATKKQAKDILRERVEPLGMPYITERWPGGLLTNFRTIKKSLKKMSTIEKNMEEGVYDNLSKRERLHIARQRDKLDRNFGSIRNMNRLPSAIFIVDVLKEHIAVREAQKLNIPIFATVDTNSNPKGIDFPIPANDDASKAITLICDVITQSVEEGLNERKMEKEKEDSEKEKKKETKKSSSKKEQESQGKPRKTRARKTAAAKKEGSTKSSENQSAEESEETGNQQEQAGADTTEQPENQQENQQGS